MRRFILHVALVLAVLVPASAPAQDAVLTVFGNYLESLRAQTGIPGMVAVLVGQQNMLWQRTYGQADVDRQLPALTSTPFHVDGLTQAFTATLILQCVEQGKLSLDDRIGKYVPNSPDAGSTIGQVLTHTTGPADNPVFSYNASRYDALAYVMSACSGDSSREMLALMLERSAMIDSIPGADSITLEPPYEGVSQADIQHYSDVLKRLATPYAVDAAGRATPSKYPSALLKPSTGLITTAADFVEFDLSLKKGILLKPDTLAAAWRNPVDKSGRTLPHGLGWFVQTYNGKQVVWQYGVGDKASSSLVMTLPSQGLTLVLLANSDGLVKPYALSAGDLIASPFGRLFLSTFVR